MAMDKQWITAIVIIAAVFMIVKYAIPEQGAVDVNVQQPTGGAQCSVIPTYTYSARDNLNGATVGVTDQIKINGLAPVTSLANPTADMPIEYWADNVTDDYVCEIADSTTACGANQLQVACYDNGNATATIALIDTAGTGTSISDGTAGANNLTIGANERDNLEIQFTGTAKQPSMPFGGCLAIEYPATLTSITLNGAGIDTAKPCPYTWTYAVSSTSNTYKLFEVPAGWDKDGRGDIKKISLQTEAGSSNPSGTAYITFQAANNYVGNDGNFYMGIEEDKNQATTKAHAQGTKVFTFVIE
jgi:hypothetical protein